MNTSAMLTFLIIGAFVWGGVALIVITAFRKEAEKRRVAARPSTPSSAPGRSTEP